MCGIAGYYGTRDISPDRITACRALMGRRGPDADGLYRHKTARGRSVVLLHSRLAIFDLDPRANQPFRWNTTVLTYNGELYNYRELRAAMEDGQGFGFRTSSDTEVLARMLAEQGWPALEECEGMWAFAAFDEATGVLTLCRDRFGEKPLYLMRQADGIYFGSEIKFLTALAGHAPAVDCDHLRRYMVNGYKALYKNGGTFPPAGSSNGGFFKGVEEVKAATVLTIAADGEMRGERYWKPALDAVDEAITFDDAVALVRERLIRSVELRLRADVPLAFCLSGGVDSNALIAIAKRVFGYDVHGFTVMNTDERYEERAMVEIAVAELGLRHTSIPVDHEDFLDKLRLLVRQHDAPVYTITYYVQWRLMERIAAQGYRVSISGTGADELFSGYFDHHNAYLAEVEGDTARYAEALGEWREFVAPIVRNPFLQDPKLFVEAPAERRHIYLNADEFAGYLRHPWSEPFAEERLHGSLLRNRMLNELFHEVVPPILHEDDLNSMYHSVENRSPFLDRFLFEATLRIPTRHFVRRGRAKALLREAVRGLAPEEVIDNPRKVGFNAPILDLLDVGDPRVRGWLLDDSPIFDLVRRDRIAELIDQAHLPNSESKFLFYFLNAKMFLEEFGR